MLSTHEDEVLQFIREFEISSKDYLRARGISDRDMADAYLQVQWEFLHTIMHKRPPQLLTQENPVYRSFCV